MQFEQYYIFQLHYNKYFHYHLQLYPCHILYIFNYYYTLYNEVLQLSTPCIHPHYSIQEQFYHNIHVLDRLYNDQPHKFYISKHHSHIPFHHNRQEDPYTWNHNTKLLNNNKAPQMFPNIAYILKYRSYITHNLRSN